MVYILRARGLKEGKEARPRGTTPRLRRWMLRSSEIRIKVRIRSAPVLRLTPLPQLVELFTRVEEIYLAMDAQFDHLMNVVQQGFASLSDRVIALDNHELLPPPPQ